MPRYIGPNQNCKTKKKQGWLCPRQQFCNPVTKRCEIITEFTKEAAFIINQADQQLAREKLRAAKKNKQVSNKAALKITKALRALKAQKQARNKKYPLQLIKGFISKVKQLYKNERIITVSQKHPKFLEHLNAALRRKFPSPQTQLTARCVANTTHRNKVGIKASLFGYQKLAKFVGHPRIDPNIRLALFWPTGSGKTLGVVKIINNWYNDVRPKVLIFPTRTVVTNFYSTLATFSNKYLTYAVAHPNCGPVKKDHEGEITMDWLNKFRRVLAMKGELRYIGTPGYLEAPLRAYSYTTAMGSAVRNFKDPIFKNFRPHNSTNPMDGKIVVMDEAHNLIESPHATTVGKANLKILRSKLYECNGSAMFFLTATPIISTPEDGRALMKIIKGGSNVPDSHYVMFFNTMPMPVYPPLVTDPLNHVDVLNIPISNHVMLTYNTKHKQMNCSSTSPASCQKIQKYCNMAGLDHHVLKKNQNQTSEYAQKLLGVAESVASMKKRTLIMIHRSNGIRTMYDIMKRIGSRVGMKTALLWYGTGSSKVSKKTNKRILSDYNKNKYQVIVVDSRDFSEGKSFLYTSRMIIVNPPFTYALLKQQYGRILRSCKSSREPVLLHVAVAVSMSVVTADQHILAKIMAERDTIEPELYKQFGQNAIGKSLLNKGMRILSKINPKITTVHTITEGGLYTELSIAIHQSMVDAYTPQYKVCGKRGITAFINAIWGIRQMIQGNPQLDQIKKSIDQRIQSEQYTCSTNGTCRRKPKSKKSKTSKKSPKKSTKKNSIRRKS